MEAELLFAKEYIFACGSESGSGGSGSVAGVRPAVGAAAVAASERITAASVANWPLISVSGLRFLFWFFKEILLSRRGRKRIQSPTLITKSISIKKGDDDDVDDIQWSIARAPPLVRHARL